MLSLTNESDKTHVCHLVYSFGAGGLEQVIVNIINHMDDPAITHTIITLTSDQSLYGRVERHCRIYCLDKAPGNDIESHIKLYKLIKELGITTLNSYNFGTLEYQFTALAAGVKNRIHSAHGFTSDDHAGKNHKRNLITKVLSIVLTKFIVVSVDLEKWALNTLGIPRKKVVHLSNGIDTSLYSPVRMEKHDNSKFVICTVGRADPIKNQALLLEAYAEALKACPKMLLSTLIVAGDGPELVNLGALVSLLQLGNHVQLLGYQSNIPGLIQSSDVFVLSSNYEAMPMTILEAMSCELPVIATNVGGTRFLLSEEEGWLVPSNDKLALANAIVSAFNDEEARRRKAKNGRQLVLQKYTIEKMCANYSSLYRGV